MSAQQLARFFETRRDRGDSLVLATVFETEGSTYSKAGARMLIDADGVFQGMLSGGCLEGDLAVRARVVLESQQAQAVTYDLGADGDDLWGLGVGCDGRMRVLLQAIGSAQSYEPFATILATRFGDEALEARLVVEPQAGTPGDTSFVSPADAAALPVYADGVLRTLVSPLPRLLVLGAGLDAEPVVRLAAEMSWRCTVSDHRPAYVEGGRFDAAERRLCCPAAEIAAQLELDSYDAAIVMSHHLDSDRSYLGQLAQSRIPYVGLLGPAGRRDRLVAELGEAGELLGDRLHAPVGLDIGGRGPAAIALSIVAELQQVFGRTD
ncbi:MAG: XdhC family protein [Woeseiaceae bacterium]|nr:XdhC family protein [Woeseiaceae bacterium]